MYTKERYFTIGSLHGRLLAACVTTAAERFGYVDTAHTKDVVLNVLRMRRPDGKVRLLQSQLEGAVASAALVHEAGLWEPGWPPYPQLIKELVPQGFEVHPYYCFINEVKTNVR